MVIGENIMEAYIDIIQKYFVTFSQHFVTWIDAVMEDPISGSAIVILGLIMLYLGLRVIGFVTKLIWLAVVGIFIVMPQYVLATIGDGFSSLFGLTRRVEPQVRQDDFLHSPDKCQDFLK